MDELLAGIQAILDQAKNEDGSERPLSDEEVAQVEGLERQVDAYKKTQEIVKRTAARGTVVTPRVVSGSAQVDSEYCRNFEQFARSGGTVGRDVIQRAQSEAVGSAGGYLVPDEWRNLIVEKRLAYGGLGAAADQLSTSDGRPLSWLTNDETSAAYAEITPENALWDTGSDLAFGTRTLGAYKYTTVGASSLPLKVSFELLQDTAFDLRGFISRKFGVRIARKQANDFVNGTGVNEPQGIISTQGGIASTTARAAAIAPTYAELLRTIHAIDPEYRDGAAWLMNDYTLGQIRGVVDGAQRPLLWNYTDDLTGALKGMTLLGYPVIVDQAMPNVAASGGAKAILFGNLKEAYVVRRVKNFEMITLNELYAQYGQVGFMGWERADGMVQDPNAAIILPNAA